MHQSSFLPLHAFSWPHSQLYLPCICIDGTFLPLICLIWQRFVFNIPFLCIKSLFCSLFAKFAVELNVNMYQSSLFTLYVFSGTCPLLNLPFHIALLCPLYALIWPRFLFNMSLLCIKVLFCHLYA